MIIEHDDVLFELKRSKDVTGCTKCDLKGECNGLVETMCTKITGFGQYWEQMDCDDEHWLRHEAELAHGKEVWND